MLLVSIFVHDHVASQSLPDSVLRKYSAASTKEERIKIVYDYSYLIREEPLFFNKAAVLVHFLDSVGDLRTRDIIQLSINDQSAKTGDYAGALASTLEIMARFEQQNDKRGSLSAYRQASTVYYYAGDKEKDKIYGKKALQIALEINSPELLSNICNNLSTSYSQSNIPDSALKYARLAVYYAKSSENPELAVAEVVGTMSEAFISSRQYDSALVYARQSLSSRGNVDNLTITWTFNDLSQIFLETKIYDSARYYAQNAVKVAAPNGYKDQLQRAYEYLSRSFDNTNKPDSAFRYLQLAVAVKDSLYNEEKTKQLRSVITNEETRRQEIEKNKLQWRNKTRTYALLAGLGIVIIIAFILLRNNRQKHKANKTLEKTLGDLKATQTNSSSLKKWHPWENSPQALRMRSKIH